MPGFGNLDVQHLECDSSELLRVFQNTKRLRAVRLETLAALPVLRAKLSLRTEMNRTVDPRVLNP